MKGLQSVSEYPHGHRPASSFHPNVECLKPPVRAADAGGWESPLGALPTPSPPIAPWLLARLHA